MARGRWWSAPETLYMLEVVEQTQPFGANQWNAVQLQYNSSLPRGFAARDADSIKRKFNALKNMRKPTGDPNCPADVARAKRVYRLIEGRCGVLMLDDTDKVSVPSATSSPRATVAAPAVTSPTPEVSAAPQSPTDSSAAEADDSAQTSTAAASTKDSSALAGINRTGKTTKELEQLGIQIQAGTTELFSESARKRRRVDRLPKTSRRRAIQTGVRLLSLWKSARLSERWSIVVSAMISDG